MVYTVFPNNRPNQRKLKKPQDKKKSKPKLKKGPASMQMRTKSAPVARGTSVSMRKPQYRSSKNGITIAHSEFFDELYVPYTAGGAFGETPIVFSYEVNANKASIFPWLYSISQRYERYRFKSLRFRYVSQVPTSTQGSMLTAFDYDPADPNPTSKVQIMSFEGAKMTPVWQSNEIVIDCSKLGITPGQWFYAANNVTGTTATVSTYQLGTAGRAIFMIDNIGAIAGNGLNFGSMFVDYVVEFEVPQADPGIVADYSSFKATVTGTDLTNLLKGTASTVGQLQFSLDPTAGTLTMNEIGQFICEIVLTGTVPVTGQTPSFTYSNGSAVTTNIMSSRTSTTSAVCSILFENKVPGTTINAVAFTGLATVSLSVLRWARYRYSLL